MPVEERTLALRSLMTGAENVMLSPDAP